MKIGDTTYKVHLDGYNLLPLLTGQAKESPRKEFFYFNDDGDLVGLRYDNWKLVFAGAARRARCRSGQEPFTHAALSEALQPADRPVRAADITSNTYYDWLFDQPISAVPAQAIVGEFLATFKDFPPSQKAGSFSVDQVLEKLKAGAAAK